MKAIAYERYGSPDVLRLIEVPTPVPANGQVLIEIRAASVNALDWRIMAGRPLIIRPMVGGLRKPKVTRPGVDVAGIVEAVGKNVTRFKPGDEVFGSCRGAFAEFACTNENALVSKPVNVSFEEAAAVPAAAITALQGLRNKGRIQRGQAVLVDGASGGVGTFAVQIAKSFGAEVTAVCSTRNVETARSIGAEHVIDYTKEDFTRSGRRYDLIFGANAYRSIFDYQRALARNGMYVMAGGGFARTLQVMSIGSALSVFSRKKLRFYIAAPNKEDLVLLRDMLEEGKIAPVIDRRYPLSDAAEAIRYLAAGHARGKVVVTMDPRRAG
jgi:NADPH:quinone reductase-like Zn-dependent oxidoreductase